MDYNLITNAPGCAIEIWTAASPTLSLSLIYYSHVPTAVVALLVGLFVFWRGGRTLASKILLGIAVSFFLWSFFDLILWVIEENSVYNMFFWGLMGILDILIYFLSLYFIYVFIEKKDAPFKYKVIAGILSLPIILTTPTDLNLTRYDAISCGAEEGLYTTNYDYLLGLLAFIAILVFVFVKYRKASPKFKKQIILVTIGMSLFLFSFFFTNFIASAMVVYFRVWKDYNTANYGLFGMPIFMGFLAYLIVHYRAFRIRFMAVQALVLTLVFLIASQFAFVQSLTNKILTGVTLGLALVFGLVLIESVKFEVRRKTEELALANSRLRKLDNAKSEFITIASHKLRTPMTAIKGFASMLLEGAYGKLEDKPKDVLNKIYMSNDRLITLAEDLLNVSRIESGRMEFVFEKVDLPSLTREVFDTFFIAAKEKNLAFKINLPASPLPEVTTDRKKLREVISDIVDNAIRYTPEGRVTIDFKKDDSFLTVAITDTGIGISPDEAVSLFTKFSRGKDVSRINTEGNGLSLHVTRSIMHSLGGRITFSSEGKGKGSTFNVMVPMRGKRVSNKDLRKKDGI